VVQNKSANINNSKMTLPYTGEKTLFVVVIVIGIIAAIVAYRKFIEYKDI